MAETTFKSGFSAGPTRAEGGLLHKGWSRTSFAFQDDRPQPIGGGPGAREASSRGRKPNMAACTRDAWVDLEPGWTTIAEQESVQVFLG
jgi:hypothetical protein